MYDAELVFCRDKSVTTAITTDAVDMRTNVVTTGQKPLYLVIFPTEDIAADTATVTFNLQASEDNQTYTTVASTGPLTAAKLGSGVALPLPTRCGRYLRMSTTNSTTAPTAGKITAYIFDKFNDPCVKLLEGIA